MYTFGAVEVENNRKLPSVLSGVVEKKLRKRSGGYF